MRYFLFALLFCMGSLLYSQSTIPMPFYQPYDSYDYNNKPDYHKLEVNFAPYTPVIRCPGSADITAVINAQGTSWDLHERTSEPERGKAIKLTVSDSALVCLGSGAVNGRTRSEMLYKLPEMEGDTTYIEWDVLIPNNLEFPDQVVAPPTANYHKIFQILVTSSNLNYPLVGVDYIHKNPMTPLDVKRDLFFRIRSPNNSSIHYRLTVTDAIEKGVWTPITYKTIWSNDDTQANVEIYIDGKPVVLVGDPPTSNNFYIATFELGSPGGTPYGIKCATIEYTSSDEGKANNIKFGHYRQNHTDSHSIYIDDLKVINSDPSDDPSPIKLDTGYCNVSIPIDNQNITCETRTGTTNYKFRFEQNGDYYWVNNGNSPTVNLLDHTFIQPATTYNVQVRAQGADFDIVYGDICSITIPHLTKLRSNDCNVVSNQYNGVIGALTVNNATNYKFRFKDVKKNLYYYGNSSTHTITPSSISGIVTGKEYEVHVRAQGPGFDFDYGMGCDIEFTSNLTTDSGSNSEMFITPNPFTKTIAFNKNVSFDAIKIFDLSGNIVFSETGFTGVSLDLHFLKDGLYFIQTQSREKIATFKLIKE